jgi:hypothetical protein
MEILVDRKKIEIEESQVHSLEEVLKKVMSEKIKPNSVITSMKVNNESIYSKEIQELKLQVSLHEVKKLEIDTLAAEDMAWDFLMKSGEHLGQIIDTAYWVSELFRIADAKEANEKYAGFLESLQLFLKIINESKRIMNFNPSLLRFGDGTVEDKIQKLSGLMDQLFKIQEEEDWVMLADLLEYELIPLLKEWKEILPLLGAKRKDS